MTIEKAIEILTIHNDHNPDFTDAEREEAHQLGIEALRAIQRHQRGGRVTQIFSLPGETKD